MRATPENDIIATVAIIIISSVVCIPLYWVQ